MLSSQRFPTVRGVTCLGNCEQRANMRAKLSCAFTGYSKSACLLGLSGFTLCKSRASLQEKRSHCSENGAPADIYIPNPRFVSQRTDVDSARTMDLDTLFEDDSLIAGNQG